MSTKLTAVPKGEPIKWVNRRSVGRKITLYMHKAQNRSQRTRIVLRFSKPFADGHSIKKGTRFRLGFNASAMYLKFGEGNSVTAGPRDLFMTFARPDDFPFSLGDIVRFDEPEVRGDMIVLPIPQTT